MDAPPFRNGRGPPTAPFKHKRPPRSFLNGSLDKKESTGGKSRSSGRTSGEDSSSSFRPDDSPASPADQDSAVGDSGHIDLKAWPESVRAIRAIGHFPQLSEKNVGLILQKAHQAGLADAEFGAEVEESGVSLFVRDVKFQDHPVIWGSELVVCAQRGIAARQEDDRGPPLPEATEVHGQIEEPHSTPWIPRVRLPQLVPALNTGTRWCGTNRQAKSFVQAAILRSTLL